MTSIGENEGTENMVLRIKEMLQIMLENSRKGIGRFQGLDRSSYGTEPISTNRMENRIKLLRAWGSTSTRADILHFVPPVPWKEENWKAKEKE